MWQEPFSALYAKFRQDHLSRDVARGRTGSADARRAADAPSLPDERRRVAFLASELQRHAGDGSAVGRIVIPRIDASYVVVKGTDTSDLESGPGIYSETNFPGVAGTTAIAGHRTTYLAPFRDINELSPGNHIFLDMPYAHFTYTVIGQRVVLPTDVSAAVSNVGYTRLVLSACTPLFSAEKRLLVYARLTKTVPVGAARVLGGRVYQPSLIQPIQAPPTAPRPHKGLPTVLKPTTAAAPARLVVARPPATLRGRGRSK